MRKHFVRAFFKRLAPWLLPLFVVVLWQVLGQLQIISAKFLPTPAEVVAALIRLLKNGQLQEHVLISAYRAVVGLLIGGFVGSFFGVMNGLNKKMAISFDTLIQMLRTIPHLSLIPLVILWFGIGEEAKFFLVAFGVAFPIYMNTYNGIRNVDQKLLEMGMVYGLDTVAIFKDIIFPCALPSILVGLRYALGVMWTSLIVAETIGADAGIGFMATTAREFMQMDVIILSILMYALFGKLSDAVVCVLEKRMLAWNPAFAGKAAERREDGAKGSAGGLVKNWEGVWRKGNT